MAARSVLLCQKAISEEEEGGALVLLFLLVGEAESALVVHGAAGEKLHLREFASNELDELGGTLLELGDTFGLAELGELGGDLTEVGSSPGHELSLGEALDLLELELVLDVNDGDTSAIVDILLLVGGDLDAFSTLGDILGLGRDAGLVEDELVGEGVRKELVAGSVISEYFHVVFSFLFCFL